MQIGDSQNDRRMEYVPSDASTDLFGCPHSCCSARAPAFPGIRRLGAIKKDPCARRLLCELPKLDTMCDANA
jgi:hypothetical protein